jgi:hypothetical protein
MTKDVAHFVGFVLDSADPGVPLRSTPGFTLTTRFAG